MLTLSDSGALRLENVLEGEREMFGDASLTASRNESLGMLRQPLTYDVGDLTLTDRVEQFSWSTGQARKSQAVPSDLSIWRK